LLLFCFISVVIVHVKYFYLNALFSQSSASSGWVCYEEFWRLLA